MTMLLRRVARPLIAGIFIQGGVAALRDPAGHVQKARPLLETVAEEVPVEPPPDPMTMVKIDAAVKIGAGTMLALGKAPRIASTALAASLIPTTLAGHAFWNETDPQARAAQRTHFMKNLALLGGLMIAAADTEAKPSLAWRGRRAARLAAASAQETLSELTGGTDRGGDKVSGSGSELAGKASGAASELAEKASGAASELAGKASGAATGLVGIAAGTASSLAARARAADLPGKGAELAEELTHRAEELSKKADKQARKLRRRASKKADKLTARASKQAARLTSVAGELGQEYVGKAGVLGEKAVATAAALGEKAAENAASAAAELNGRVKALTR